MGGTARARPERSGGTGRAPARRADPRTGPTSAGRRRSPTTRAAGRRAPEPQAGPDRSVADPPRHGRRPYDENATRPIPSLESSGGLPRHRRREPGTHW
ncbi:hypothetical protein HBB16_11065 [Pseudonocardia sp. MCCB 268]|nr:hypothetical protein [Pseudonocardia cytotoxica]